MRALALYTCPLWERHDGERLPGMHPTDSPPPIVGWVNVLDIEIGDEIHRLLLTRHA